MTFNINCIPLLIIWCVTLATIPSIYCKEIDSTPSSALYGTGKIFTATGSNHQTRLIINQHSNNCPFNYIGVITRTANSFPEFLTQSFLAIDKSLLIREILRNKGEPVLITCPRKWGKTTNMLMLESFLKITVDEDGNVIPRENTIEFRLFRDGVLPNNRSLNHPLLIYEKEKEWFMENMGVTPVIYVTFDGVRGNNLEEIVNAVRTSMSPTFRKHAYLKWFLNRKIEKENPSGQSSLQTDYKDFEDIESYNHTTTTEQIERSLHLLTRLLNEFYQKKVFLILDDYDALISEIYINPDFSKSDVEKTLKFYNNLMQTSLKNRDIIEGCVLTGIFHLTENEFLSPTINNLQTTSFLNNPLFFYYGINQFELKGLYEMLRIDGQTKTTHFWYNGYHAGLHSQLRITNPWSVACYLQNGTYRSFWEGGARRVEHLLEGYFNNANFLNQFHKLIRNESIQANDKSYDLRFSKQDFVDMMKNIRFEECTKREYHIDNAMKFFLATGYVALADTHEYDHKKPLLLRVPNFEVRLAMKMELERFVMKLDETKYSPALQEVVSNFRNFFLENDNTTIENFQTALTAYFASIPPMIKMEELAKTELSTPWKQYILGNEKWINSIIHNIGFLADFQLQTIEGELMVDQENSKLDAIFANETRGMIVEFKFHKQGDIDEQLHDRLNEIKKSSYAYFFKKYFQPFRPLNDVKIASVLVCPNGTTRVWAETANPWIWSEKQVVGDEEKTVYSIYKTYDHELNDTEAKKPIFEDDLKKLDVPRPQIVSDILLHSMKNLESSSLVKCKQFFIDAKTYNAINESDFVKGILSFANAWRDNIKWFPNMWKNLSDINSFMLEAKCYKKYEFDNELKNLLQDAYSQPEFFNNFKKHDNILFHFYLNKIISQQQMKNVMDLLTKEKSDEKARKKYYDIINKFVKELWRNNMNLKHKTTKAKKE